MTADSTTTRTFSLGPIWRDANVRTGPSLDSPIIQLLLPDDQVAYTAHAWVLGDEVIEGEHVDGEITSSVWFALSLGGWCSAVNFDQATIAGVPDDARLGA